MLGCRLMGGKNGEGYWSKLEDTSDTMFVITNAARKSVVLIASSKLLA